MSVAYVLSDENQVFKVLYGFTGSVCLAYFFIPELLDRKASIPSHQRITLSLQVRVCIQIWLTVAEGSLCSWWSFGVSADINGGGKAITKLVWALLCPEQLFFKSCMWETPFLWGISFPVCLCSLMLALQLVILAKHPASWSVTQKLEAFDSAQWDQLNHSSASDRTTTSPLQLALNHQYTQSCS